MTPGWYADPSGRFPQRYFDGRSWTEQVVGANGMTTVDPAADVAGLPAPNVPAPMAPSAGRSTTVGAAAQAGTSRRLSWFGLAVATAGTALAALSVTALSWASDISFGDLREVSDTLQSSSYDDAKVAYHYGAWGWFVLLALVLVGLVLVASVVKRRDGTMLRLVVAGVAAIGVVFHAGYVAEMFEGPGPSPDFGAWAGSIGYLLAIVGLAIATPRRRSRA